MGAAKTSAAHRSIVTITSSNAQAVSVQRGEYCVSKAALSMVSSLFAVSKARYNADIARGWLVTPRWGQPQDVARVVTTLAQGLLPYTVGQAIRVDGGMLIHKY